MLAELSRREPQAGILPEPVLHASMKASLLGQKASLVTGCILKVLGLDICANTMIGGNMRRGISRGQKKCVTTVCNLSLSPSDVTQFWSTRVGYHLILQLSSTHPTACRRVRALCSKFPTTEFLDLLRSRRQPEP